MRFFLLIAITAAVCVPVQADDSLTTGPAVRALAFSTDGKYLAAASGEPDEPGRATVWELSTGKVRFEHREPKGIPAVAFSPDGKRLVIGSFTENAIIIDGTSWALERRLPGHGKAARGVAFSHDGKTLAVTSYDGFIRLWDPAAWSVKKSLDNAHAGWVYTAAFSRDGRTLASCGADNTAKLWDLASGKTLHTFKHARIIRRIQFTPDDRRVIYASWDGSLAIRDRTSGNCIVDFEHSGDDLSITKDGKQLAVTSRGGAMILSIEFQPADEALHKRFRQLSKGWDDDRIAVRDQATKDIAALGRAILPLVLEAARKAATPEARLRAAIAAAAIRAVKPRLTLHHSEGEIQSVAFSPDGLVLASGGPEGIVRLWNAATGRASRLLRQFPPPSRAPRSEF